jgi:uncharacterized damage-inducible protein DinB
MSALRMIQKLTRYNAWANSILYASLQTLDSAELIKPRPGRSKGLLGILGHNYVVDLIWQANLQGRDHGFTSRTLGREMDLNSLRDAQIQLDQWYLTYAAQQTENTLSEVLAFTYVSGVQASMQRGDMLLHTVNHKTYHRGYVADMLYEMGGKPPSMDLNVFLTKMPTELTEQIINPALP